MRQNDTHKHVPARRDVRLLLMASTLAALAACFNSHVFDIIDPCEVQQTSIGQSIEPATAADILIVVDNSGSMCEEQANLIANFYNDNVNECPLADPAAYELEDYQNPSDTVVNTDLAGCGFIQILAAYDNDFRVGVITTDVGPCDNRFGFADDPAYESNPAFNCALQAFPDWGRRPQRGCLQGPPGAPQKFLDPNTENIGEQFEAILLNTRTYGSAFERGLDAVKMFLDPQTERHESCTSDLDDFIRPEASLLVVFLSDEDDCSYTPSDNFPDEAAGESCDNARESFWQQRDPQIDTKWCYERQDALNPVTQYADFLKSYKGPDGTVKIAVIAGATKEGGIQPEGCRIVNGAPSNVCTPSFGNSNSTLGATATCNPDNLANQGLPPCCEADDGNRYYQLASAFPAQQSFTDSICFESFRTTMRQLAAFAAKVDSVLLPTPPAVPEAITVEILRDGAAEPETITRIPDDEPNPDDLSGWQLTVDDGNNYKVSFYGDAVPQPGDDIAVYILDEGDTSSGDVEPCIGFASDDTDAGD